MSLRISDESLGRWFTSQDQSYPRSRFADFAEVTGDPYPLHRSGQFAPPVFAILPILPVATAAILAAVGMTHAGDYPGFHGEHLIDIRAPLTPDLVVRTRAAVVAIRATKAGAAIIVRCETRDQRRRMLNAQIMTSLLPGASVEADVGIDPRRSRPRLGPTRGETPMIIEQAVNTDLPLRFADLSGDRHPYHLDPVAARAAGLPGVILHGACTLALSSIVLVATACHGDPRRLRRLGARFSNPVMPGAPILTRVIAGPPASKMRRYFFETAQMAGRLVLRNGIADVRGDTDLAD